jgi:hypothetical protein
MTTAIAAESVQDAIKAYEAAKVEAEQSRDLPDSYDNDVKREDLADAFVAAEMRLENLLVAMAGPGQLSAVLITPDKTYIAAFEPYEEDGPLHLIIIPTTRVMDVRG